MSGIDRLVRVISLGMAAAGGLAMLGMMGIICTNIALRLGGAGIRGSVEISGYLCALAVGLCLPASQLAGSHIAAGLWQDVFSRSGLRVQMALTSLICASLLALAAREIWGVAGYALDMEEVIEGFNFSYFPMAMGLALGLVTHALIFVLNLLSLICRPETSR